MTPTGLWAAEKGTGCCLCPNMGGVVAGPRSSRGGSGEPVVGRWSLLRPELDLCLTSLMVRGPGVTSGEVRKGYIKQEQLYLRLG